MMTMAKEKIGPEASCWVHNTRLAATQSNPTKLNKATTGPVHTKDQVSHLPF
jgi:hypothetical protein